MAIAQRDYLSSDLHFLHAKLVRERGFGDDIAAHDATLISNWNSVVRPQDRVMLLGDVSLAEPGKFWPLVDQLNGEIHLIAGNHDAVHPMHRDARKHQEEWLRHFESVQAFARIRLEGQDVLLSHFPYEGDSGPVVRGEQYRLRDNGLTVVHGHTHGNGGQVTRSSKGSLQIHVGPDSHDLRPVDIAWVQKVIRDRAARDKAFTELVRLGEEIGG